MYKALNYWVFGGFTGEKSPKEFIDFAVANGLDGIELTVGDAINESITEEECRAIAEYAKAKGVGLKTLATGKYGSLSLGAADEAERQEAIAFTKKTSPDRSMDGREGDSGYSWRNMRGVGAIASDCPIPHRV